MKFLSLLMLLLFTNNVLTNISLPDNDKVDLNNFHNYPYKDTDMYSGYLNITKTKNLHYVFVLANSEDKNLPLALWLNGGPGCSSLIGFLNENGPAVTKDDNSEEVVLNQYSWNKKAHMLYIEAPAGVGFSRGSTIDTYTNDDTTAKDNLSALLSFFEKFPDFQSRDFYITGESYNGIYIPTLAKKILEYNDSLEDKKLQINLKGIFIGNGITDWKIEAENSMFEFLFTHSVLSKEGYEKYLKACTELPWSMFMKQCEAAVKSVEEELKDIFLYDIIRKCYKTKSDANRKRFNSNLSLRKKLLQRLSLSEDDICHFGDGTEVFFNRSETKASLHVDENIQWRDCADLNYYDGFVGSLYTYPYLFDKGLKIWHYNGDTDAVVPFNGTLKWIDKLNLDVAKKWTSWKVDKQDTLIAGYRIQYSNNFTFVTVRGGGHMIPQWKPKEMLKVFDYFIQDKDLIEFN